MSFKDDDQHHDRKPPFIDGQNIEELSTSSTHQGNTNMMIIQSRYIQGGV